MRIITYTWLEKKHESDADLSRKEKSLVQDYLRRKNELKSQGFDPIVDLGEAQRMAVDLDVIGMRL